MTPVWVTWNTVLLYLLETYTRQAVRQQQAERAGQRGRPGGHRSIASGWYFLLGKYESRRCLDCSLRLQKELHPVLAFHHSRSTSSTTSSFKFDVQVYMTEKIQKKD